MGRWKTWSWMDGRMAEWIDGWIDGLLVGLMGAWVDGWIV